MSFPSAGKRLCFSTCQLFRGDGAGGHGKEECGFAFLCRLGCPSAQGCFRCHPNVLLRGWSTWCCVLLSVIVKRLKTQKTANRTAGRLLCTSRGARSRVSINMEVTSRINVYSAELPGGRSPSRSEKTGNGEGHGKAAH